jgi:O-antigen ligase
MALPLGLGYSLGLVEREQRRRRWSGWLRWITTAGANELWLAALSVVVLGTTLVATGSRSGMIGLAAVVVVAVAGFAIGSANTRAKKFAAAGYVGALLLAAVAWAGADPAIQRFARAPADIQGRLQAWRDTVRIARDFPVFGSGLDTYGTAMLLYQTGNRIRMYREAHNEYLQLAAEGGLLLGVPAAIAAGLLVREIRRRFRERRDDGMRRGIRIGAVAALAGIAVQSLADFSLQMPGNAAFFVVVAAIAVHRPPSSEGSRAHRL